MIQAVRESGETKEGKLPLFLEAFFENISKKFNNNKRFLTR